MNSTRIINFLDRHPIALDLGALLLAFVIIHVGYTVFVFPEVDRLMGSVKVGQALPARSFAIVVKDPEQEICLILGIWCLALLGFRYRLNDSDQSLLEADFTETAARTQSEPELRRRLAIADELAPRSVLVPAVSIALDNYLVSRSLEQAQLAAFEHCNLREEVTDSNLTAVRYVLWAIPSIGFIGTVRGIGDALARADEAMSGDISGIAASLGVAFNSTFVALLVSLLLTLVANGLRGREQMRLVRCKTFIAGKFLVQLKALESQDEKASRPEANSNSIGNGALVS